jgi:type II secretory pathway component GspD/PulD (secretin)
LVRFQAFLVWLSAVSLAILASSASVAWAQPAAEEKAPQSAPKATTHFARIVDPALAEKLKLSDEQRIQIANLQTERTEALAKAAPDQRATVLADFEQKLGALLNDDQKAELAKPGEAATEPKLRFSFRFQRWSDVLEWFAEQANLSLVIDAPPPGTFNYSDNRDYSVSEALDLLNGVLLTKGYTLIRRDRMLTVINLADGVPEALVPRITLTDLESRGRFEIVSMLFPVGKRDVEEVVKEITPLLGPRGKSQALPKTKQILVTDTAGVMRAISAVIESIPQPEKPRGDEPMEKPLLVVYPLKSADPDAAVKVLEALLPTGRFVRDPKANQISAYATPTQQEAVKRVVEQLQTDAAPGEEQTRFEVYQLDDADPKQALATLQPLVPNARLSVDPASKKLAAWGTKADHALLARAVEQLGRGGGPHDNRQVEVYRLKKAEPTAALVVLQNIVPNARLSVDAASRSIIALANLADQKTIRATLDQLEPPQGGPDGAEIRLYSLTTADPASVMSVVQTLFPTAKLVLDSKNRRLAAWTRPADQETIKTLIEQMDTEPAGGSKNELMVYPVTSADLSATITTLKTLVPEATLTADSKAGTIVAWARKADQAKIVDALERLQPDDPKTKPRIVAYEVGASDPTVLYPLIGALVPTARVVPNAKNGTIAVWATAADHETIRAAIAEMTKNGPLDAASKVVVYPLRAAEPATLAGMLQILFPTARFTSDVKNRRLLVFGRAAEQGAIKAAIDEMDAELPGGSKNELKVYPVTADLTAAITTLKTLAPDATLTVDTKAGAIIAWARKADQVLIAGALEQLQPVDPKSKPHIVAYEVGASDPTVLYPMISTLVPTARVVPNAKNGTIAVWATAADHETIRAAIGEMTKDGPLDAAAKVVVYPLKAAEPTSLVGMLQTLFPGSRFTFDVKNRRLLVFGRPAEQQTIKTAIEQMDVQPADEANRRLAVFPIVGADPTATMTMLRTLLPQTTLTNDTRAGTILAWGPQSELDKIAPALEQMQAKGDPRFRARIVSYSTAPSDPATLYPLIGALVPTARVVPNAKAGTIAVWATPDEHETIRAAIDEMTAKGTDANAPRSWFTRSSRPAPRMSWAH